ncbi:hypothetical protein E2C01_002524 [Portunus trituberculatus]|uniref:Uncharacterized protein n=1 Tax=Portunus trituberculatus TaxID=210409 RepID=A0A5B7CNH2_PORTR|nr:hypothetical protein [Portunus trituberculatus]
MVDIWSRLSKEIVTAESVHEFKEKLDKSKYGDRPERRGRAGPALRVKLIVAPSSRWSAAAASSPCNLSTGSLARPSSI